MTQSDVDEILTALYLRLNGYFTTGLIVHSPEWGHAGTEVDCLAIRNRYHTQTDRQVDTSDFLDVDPTKTDLLICEVKSDVNYLGFNESIRKDLSLLDAAMRWAGILPEEDIETIVEQLQPLLDDNASADQLKAGVVTDSYRIRPLLSCPSALDDDVANRWCLIGSELLKYIHTCLNPEERRETCSTRYNFQQWSYPYVRLVQFIKDQDPQDVPDLSDVYNFLLGDE